MPNRGDNLRSESSAVIQHHHIDIGSVLRGAVCELYSNLVTRPTGVAVRSEIERAIEEMGGRTVTVIDFSQVTILDFSCADEIVAKLMLRYCRRPQPGDMAPQPGYFVFRGLDDHHLDAVEAVLERHGLAIVAVLGGVPALVGDVDPDERATWEQLRILVRADAPMVARALGAPLDAVSMRLASLAEQRLVVQVGDAYAALDVPTPEAAA